MDTTFYTGTATVHWTHTMDRRATGWLGDEFHAFFRECLIHAGFRFGLWSPAYCLMPDHIHLVWSGVGRSSDQLRATRWLRRRINEALQGRGIRLQKQAYDRVLRPADRERFAFEKMMAYVIANPLRAGLAGESLALKQWPWRGAILSGYPELSWKASPDSFCWDRYWKLFYQALEGEGWGRE
ncbi:MAG: hypothetical protein GXX91_17090 [Verrucomicrobiaceae bacterium]|nr:hypothetical protein [Verrucomicrobiaceae bacterium]